MTSVDPALTRRLEATGALVLDVFAPFVGLLEAELGETRQAHVGAAHAVHDTVRYDDRISATHYALAHDDGIDTSYQDAEVILVGVSRSGKTPTCLYLGLHFGVRAGNYPLTEEDLEKHELPPFLRAHRKRLFGLTIDPGRLRQVREARRPGSRYASPAQCASEVLAAERLFRHERIPVLSTTTTSVEEIASKILSTLGIERDLF